MRAEQNKHSKMRLCQILLCILLLAGCRRPAPADPVGDNLEREIEERNSGELAESMDLLTMDPGFWECVRRDAGIGEEDTQTVIREKLEQCEALTLKEVPYGASACCSLKDLKYLPQLKSLSIEFHSWDDSRVEDFTPIAKLAELEQLHISYVEGETIDISFLGKMNTVTELFLTSCQLRDAAFLKEMTGLKHLSLEKTSIEDMEVLKNLTELKELSVAGNPGVAHMETVGKLHKLEDLRLEECGIRDIEFISSLTELRRVDLHNNFITDITPLAGLTELEWLILAENEISDLAPAAGLTNLSVLSVAQNKVRDISPLTELSHLNQAGFSDNQIEDFSPLEGKTELMTVSVGGNPCESLKPVLQIPILYIWRQSPSEEQLKTVGEQIEKQWPNLEEYECMDYVEGDLNGDGHMDAAFVVEGAFGFDLQRRLFVLLGQTDGSFREVQHTVSIWDKDARGTRGDPYRGIWMEKGCFLLQQSYGSRGGALRTELYRYENGRLELSQTTKAEDRRGTEGFDITVHREETGEEFRSAIIMEDGWRMVRVNLEEVVER